MDANRALDTLGPARYISLITYKRSGDPVRTPVWCARRGDRLVVFTGKNSYKMKRLRRNPAVRVAVCNASGKKIRSEWFDGTGAQIEDPAVVREVEAQMRDKYGWQFRLIRRYLRWKGVYDEHGVLEISFDEPAPS